MHEIIALFCLFTSIEGHALQVNNLGSPEYLIREAAHKAIEAHLKKSNDLVGMMVAKHKTDDPETKVRILSLTEGYTNIYPHGFFYWPKIDRLPKDFPNRQKVIDEYLYHAELAGYMPKIWDWACNCHFYPGQYKATELLVADLLQKGWWPKQVKELLEEMQHGAPVVMPYAN